MEIRRGIGVSSGYAIGEAYVFDRENFRVSRRTLAPAEIEGEIRRLQKASEEAAAEIRAQMDALPERIREVAGSILEAQIRMLQDKTLLEEIGSEIRRNSHTADFSASRTLKRKVKVLEESGAAAFAERAVNELGAIEKSLLRHLVGSKKAGAPSLKSAAVIIAHDLSPSQTLRLDRKNTLGLVIEVGGPTSHTAIVARSLGIPAVVGAAGISVDVSSGDMVILDGVEGKVILNPDEATLKRYQAMERNFVLLERQRARELHDLPAVTRDGTRIQILANIESPEEIPVALDMGAEGVGLYRTEFLYLDNNFEPTEKEHLEAYRRAIELLGKRKIVIRTMDLGADKMPLDGSPPEDNPFLGTRAIRLCFERPEMFKAQLRSILRVTSLGQVGMMVPMISSLSEVRKVKEILEEVRAELRSHEEPAGDSMELGIMIEVPSAAVMADILAAHVDFLSVGTNDLIGYSVAVDRKNERVAALYQPGHPAILRLLKQVIDAGQKHGKPVSVCGEMSGDLVYTLLLVGLGLRTFSVAPPAIPDLKKLIRSVSLEEAQAVAARALLFDEAEPVLEYLKAQTRRFLPDSP